MFAPSNKHFIHGSSFILANQLQLLGDRITGDITSKQWFVLLAVSQMKEEISIISVANEIRSSRQNTAKLLEQLYKKGLLELRRSDKDKRSRNVYLTNKGKMELARISKIGNEFIEEVFSGITNDEIECGMKLFQNLIYNMDQMKERLNEKKD